MKRFLTTIACLAMLGAIATSHTGCSKEATNTGMSLFNALGGAEQIGKIASSFGSKLLADPRVSKFLNQQTADAIANGLVNEISKLSGMTPPTSDNLLDTLRGAKLDKPAVEALPENLEKAADENNVPAAEKKSLMGVLEPITKSLMAEL